MAYHQTGEWVKAATEERAERPWPSPRTPGYVRLTQTSSRTIAGENLSLETKLTGSLNPIIAIASTSPTEIIAGYGILKTTEDLAPVLIQRRTTRQTAYIWAIALDGLPPTLRISAATSSEGKILPLSKAVLVEVLMGKSENSVCVNPHALRVTATLQDGFGIKTDKIFSAY